MNAKITVDLVFLQKTAKKLDWQISKPVRIGERTRSMNEYFINHPEHVLGDLLIVPMYDRFGITCHTNGDLRRKLLNAYARISDAIRR